MLTVFGSIGLSMLMPALSLRRNTKEYIPVKKLDEASSGCFSCHYYKSGSPACEACESKAFYTETKVRYINEGSRYGKEKQVLKKNALLLYIYLHFLDPDQNGLVAKIDVREVAEALHCNERTIVNNLELLNRAKYISLGKTMIPGNYQAFITGYSDIFKKASEGGRGFLRLGSDFMSKLCDLPDTNAIRLAIRSYLNDVDLSNKPRTDRERSLKDLKSQLPEYVTKKDLLKTLNNPVFNSMFSVTAKQRSATIITMPEYNQANVIEKVRSQCTQEVNKLVNEINRQAKGTKKKPGKFPLRLSQRDIADIVNISLKIPIKSVLAGLSHFYKTYVERSIYYDSAGALVRAFAHDHMIYGLIGS